MCFISVKIMKKMILISEDNEKDDSEQEDCDNELQTAVDLFGYPRQQGLSFFGFFLWFNNDTASLQE